MFILPRILILVEYLEEDFWDADDDVDGNSDREDKSESFHHFKFVLLTLLAQVRERAE